MQTIEHEFVSITYILIQRLNALHNCESCDKNIAPESINIVYFDAF